MLYFFFPQEEPLLACKQGCRLSAIAQLKTRVSDVKDENFTLACIAGKSPLFFDSFNRLFSFCLFMCSFMSYFDLLLNFRANRA